MNDVLYYLMDNCACIDSPFDLKTGVRIIAFKGGPYPISEKLEGPYTSISQITKLSPIYKKLMIENGSRAQKIIEEKNILIVSLKDAIFVKHGEKHSEDFLKAIQHSVKGNLKANKILGVHFFDESNMRIKTIIGETDQHCVWKAIVDVFERQNNKWFSKESTFFPRSWTRTQLFHELKYAYEHRTKVENSQFRYEAKTSSGVPVIIIIKNGKLSSIYPVYQETNKKK
jgi:hypothetical protein